MSAERKLELLKIYMDFRIDWMATKLEHKTASNYHFFLQAVSGKFMPFEPLRRYWDNFPSFDLFLRRYNNSSINVMHKRELYCLVD